MTVADDRRRLADQLSAPAPLTDVHEFRPGPGVERLDLQFDPELLLAEWHACRARLELSGEYTDHGFSGLAVTRRPGVAVPTSNDLSGRYWTHGAAPADDPLVPHEDLVDEAAFVELHPDFTGTYFETVVDALRERFTIGRVRLNVKSKWNCNSWHRDPEPRLHVPIVTDPGALMIVDHHVTHLPADGGVYFTDTRRWHTALNGGQDDRVHLVAALVV